MLSLPSSSRLGGRLRRQLLALWLGSILVVLLLVGLVLGILIDDFHLREARRDSTQGIAQFRTELVAASSVVSRQAELLKARRSLVATINMVHRYQDLADYKPLVFDPEKRQLAQLLADLARSAELSFIAVYDGHGRMAAFTDQRAGGPIAGYHTLTAEGEALLVQGQSGWQVTAPPALTLTPEALSRTVEDDVAMRLIDGKVVMETVAPIERNLANSPPQTIGYVQVARVLGDPFLAALASRSGVGIGMVTGSGQTGNLPIIDPARLSGAPDISDPAECPCLWLKHDGHDIAATSVGLDDGNLVFLLAGMPDKGGSAVIRFYQMAAAAVLLGVALLVIPGGIVLLDQTLMVPLSRLLDGVDAVRHGRPIQLAPAFKDNEFGTLARSFDAMAGSIRAREEDLRQTIDHLADSNAELQRFAMVAAHDLQEPLRMVASYTQLLQRRYQGRLDPDADEFIGFAVEGAERMKMLIQDLADYSRVDADQHAFARVDCADIVAATLRDMADMISETGARITVVPLPSVNGNAAQLTLVFQNLVSNALKFRRGTPEIDISALPAQAGGWEFVVRDNGIGIGADYIDQLFTLFRRLHTRQEYPGSGLGLAICRRIIERHGGRIWAESQEGVGTAIHFTLPG